MAAEGFKPPSSMKLVSTAERQLARQLHEEQHERNRAVTELWTRLKEVDEQIQVLQAHSQKQQTQTLAPAQLHVPIQDPNNAWSHRELEASTSASASEIIAFEVSSQVSRLEERVQVVMDQMNESQTRFSKDSAAMAFTTQPAWAPPINSTESYLEGLPANPAAALASLQSGLKDLDTKHKQMAEELSHLKAANSSTESFLELASLQSGLKDLNTKHERIAKEVSHVKGEVTEVSFSMQINAIRTTRIALQSSELSRDERHRALEALDKKELECKGHSRKVCNSPRAGDFTDAFATTQ